MFISSDLWDIGILSPQQTLVEFGPFRRPRMLLAEKLLQGFSEGGCLGPSWDRVWLYGHCLPYTSNTKSGDLGSCWSLIDHDAFHCIIVYIYICSSIDLHTNYHMISYGFVGNIHHQIQLLSCSHSTTDILWVVYPPFSDMPLPHLAPRRLHRGSRSQYLRIVCRVGYMFFWWNVAHEKLFFYPPFMDISRCSQLLVNIGDIDIDM